MNLLASPAQIALSTVAVGWPVAAATGFVVWSNLRRRRQPDEEAAAMMRVPLGAASPLWGLFMGAAATGAAFWWMSQWTKPKNLEAVFGAVSKPLSPELAPSAVVEAALEPAVVVFKATETVVET